MSKFHALQVASVKNETSDAVSIAFNVPESLKEEFKYSQGQYLTLRATINGEDIRRAYSLCSSPATGELPTVTCKRVEGGRMSNYLADNIQSGSTIEVMPPEGRFFTEVNEGNTKHYILVGGGSGITPLISIIKTVLLKEPNSKCSLIYGNRNANAIIFKTELDELSNKYPGRLKLVYSIDTPQDGWGGLTGLLTKDKLMELIQAEQGEVANREYFLCGPEGLMNQAREAFTGLNLPEPNVHIEYFSAPVSDKKEEETKEEPALDFEGSKVTVILDGKESEITITDNTSILHAAIKQGLDAPFSCEAGICSTCMAKVMEGEVKMDENNILSDDEVAKGYVLTCQSHPTTKIVKLEYYD